MLVQWQRDIFLTVKGREETDRGPEHIAYHQNDPRFENSASGILSTQVHAYQVTVKDTCLTLSYAEKFKELFYTETI